MWVEELPNGKYKYFERYKDTYTVEVETMEKDAALKDMQRELEIEKTRQELELLKNVRAFEITVDSPNVSYENVAQTQMDFDENQGEG